MLRYAVVGTGSIVDTFIQATETIESVEAYAVCSRSHERGSLLAKRYGIEFVFTSYEALLEEAAIDVVYIALPNTLHFDYAMQALSKGKHVILEKPFVLTPTEAVRLFERAEEMQCMIFEAMSVQYQPNYQRLKSLCSKIGQIKLVQAQYSQRSSRYDGFKRGLLPNIFNPELGGGALNDLNVYNLSFLAGLFGEPAEVLYRATRAENGVDTSGVIVLDYGEFVATAIAAKDSNSESFAIIQGDEGYLKIEGPVSISAAVTHYDQRGQVVERFVDQAENRLTAEVMCIEAMITQNDRETYDAYKSVTLKTVALLFACQKSE